MSIYFWHTLSSFWPTVGRFILPRDKSILFLEYYAPCIRYLIDFLCIIVYNDHFTRRKCILSEPDKSTSKKCSGVMDFYATSKNLLENIHSQMLDVQDIRWPRNEYELDLDVFSTKIEGWPYSQFAYFLLSYILVLFLWFHISNILHM